jgi:hypothetical protein
MQSGWKSIIIIIVTLLMLMTIDGVELTIGFIGLDSITQLVITSYSSL